MSMHQGNNAHSERHAFFCDRGQRDLYVLRTCEPLESLPNQWELFYIFHPTKPCSVKAYCATNTIQYVPHSSTKTSVEHLKRP